MKYVYPAIFTPLPSGEYDVRIPDLPGCITCGKDLPDAIEMAEDAIAMWLCDAEDNQESIPAPSESLTADRPCFVNLIVADTVEYRKENDNRAVKKTLSIPSWLNVQAEKAGVNFSQILQDALKSHLSLGHDDISGDKIAISRTRPVRAHRRRTREDKPTQADKIIS
jgi:predicted RNase H-like HicB family nuclease